MDIPVTSRIHRILVRMDVYTNFKDCDKNPDDYPLDLEAGEIPLGVYENIPGRIEDSIIVTDQAIHYCETDNHSRKVQYQNINRTSFFKDKDKPLPLRIELRNGETFFLPFKAGPHGKGLGNACGFIRFIDRVVGDTKVRNGKGRYSPWDID